MNQFRTWAMRGVFVALAATAALLSLTGQSAHAGGVCHTPPTSGSEPAVHINGICFAPTVVHVKAGDTVTWNNDFSGIPHTVTGVNGLFGSIDQISAGSSYSHVFTDTGIYPYYCFLHPGMAGAVVVGDGGDSGEAAANVSLAGGAQAGETAAAVTTGGNGIDHLWLFVLLSAAAAIATAGAGYVVGTRRAKQ